MVRYLDPGERTTPLVLEQLVRARDTHGNVVETWATLLATVWVKLQPMTGRELLLAASVESRVTHRVTMEYRLDATVGAAMRFRTLTGAARARVFNVEDVRDLDEAHVLLELDVQEVEGALP